MLKKGRLLVICFLVPLVILTGCISKYPEDSIKIKIPDYVVKNMDIEVLRAYKDRDGVLEYRESFDGAVSMVMEKELNEEVVEGLKENLDNIMEFYKEEDLYEKLNEEGDFQNIDLYVDEVLYVKGQDLATEYIGSSAYLYRTFQGKNEKMTINVFNMYTDEKFYEVVLPDKYKN